MYLPIETQTAALALSTVIASSPTSFTSEIAQPTQTEPPAVFLENLRHPSPRVPVPDIFAAATHEDDFYHIGDDKVDECLREAVKYAGRARFGELKSDGGWTDFLSKSRDHGLVGSDANQDGNSVHGLADYVKSLAEHDDPPLDPDTEVLDTCILLVQRLTSDQMLDEVILRWADNRGHLEHLPQTSSHVERRAAESGVIRPHRFYAKFNKLTYFDEIIERVHSKGKAPHLPGGIPVPGNSTGPVEPVAETDVTPHRRVDTDSFAPGIFKPAEWLRKNGQLPPPPGRITVPGNSTRTVECVAVDVDDYGLPAEIAAPGWNLTMPFHWTINGTLLPGNSTGLGRSTPKFNLTRRGEEPLVVRPVIIVSPKPSIERSANTLDDTHSLESGEVKTHYIPHPDTQYPKPIDPVE